MLPGHDGVKMGQNPWAERTANPSSRVNHMCAGVPRSDLELEHESVKIDFWTAGGV